MDSYTYGRMVEHGGYATGGVVSLISAGFTSESVRVAVACSDMTLLRHSGFFSVQLEPPGAQGPDDGCAGVPARV